MEFPKELSPINVFEYLMKYIVGELKFNPNNFIHLFSLALGVNKVKKGSYGCIFIGYPGEKNYFGDDTPKTSFSIGYKIYKEDEEKLIDDSVKHFFKIEDHITIAIGKHLYPANLSEIAVLYYLIKNRNEINFNEEIEIDRQEVYNNITDLLDYGNKVADMIKQKQEKYEKKMQEHNPEDKNDNINESNVKTI
jgi:hypothetical protein